MRNVWTDMGHDSELWERRGVDTELYWENYENVCQFRRPRRTWKDNIKQGLGMHGVRLGCGRKYLDIVSSGGPRKGSTADDVTATGRRRR
jgi:hypothetical protein